MEWWSTKGKKIKISCILFIYLIFYSVSYIASPIGIYDLSGEDVGTPCMQSFQEYKNNKGWDHFYRAYKIACQRIFPQIIRKDNIEQ